MISALCRLKDRNTTESFCHIHFFSPFIALICFLNVTLVIEKGVIIKIVVVVSVRWGSATSVRRAMEDKVSDICCVHQVVFPQSLLNMLMRYE